MVGESGAGIIIIIIIIIITIAVRAHISPGE
jgi:hypothetical protein